MSRFRKDPDPRFWRLNRSVEFDWRLAPYDIDQSQAHARALQQIGVLSAEELDQLDAGLERVRARIGERGFEFEEADEDIHMAIERLLEAEVGPLAGKLHTGRSRNDQVATDVAMVVQNHSMEAIELAGAAMRRLLTQAETRARDLLTSHREALAQLTAALLEQETVTGDQVRALAQAASPAPLTDGRPPFLRLASPHGR